MSPAILICILCVFAYFAKGLTGAASAIVFNAGLLLALALGVSGGLGLLDGLYWISLGDFFSNALLAVLLWRQIRLERLTVLLCAGMLPTAILFALLLPMLDLRWLSVLLAVAVIGGGLYLALRRDNGPISPLAAAWWAVPTGLIAGVLSGLFGMGGPIVFILLSRASDDPGLFRSRSLVITNVVVLARMITLAGAGAFESRHLHWALVAAPVIVAAMLAGMWVHTRIKPRPFRIVLGALVVLAGAGGLLRFTL